MGICYGVEKEILNPAALTHERLLEDESADSDIYHPAKTVTEQLVKDLNDHLADADGAEKTKSKDKKNAVTDDQKVTKRNRDKKERKHKSSKKDKKNAKGSKDKDKVDVKPPEEYLMERLKLEMNVLNPPSNNKKCLVLDIDYTIFDHKSDFDLAQEFKRPYLHEFLKVCHTYYNIVIWSATATCHIQTKMEKLHLLDHPDFKISLVLCKDFMIPHPFPGKHRVHVQEIKPLSLIWRKFGNAYNASNTIHIDDVVENFAINPQNGLRIEPFRDALQSRQTDKELFYLTQYLLLIGNLPTLEGLDHMRWKDYIINRLFEAQNMYSLPTFLAPPPPSTSLLAHHHSVLIARNEIKDKERKSRHNKDSPPLISGLPVEVIRIELGEHVQREFVWGSTERMPVVTQLS